MPPPQLPPPPVVRKDSQVSEPPQRPVEPAGRRHERAETARPATVFIDDFIDDAIDVSPASAAIPPGRDVDAAPEVDEPDVEAAPPSRSFSQNTLIMATGTLLSRLTGFGKVLALAWVFGVNRLADSYNLANNLPNQVYDLVLGGVLSATLIPVFVEQMARRNQREGWRAISAVVSMAFAGLVLLSIIFWFVAPAIIDLLLIRDHGAAIGPERNLAIHLLRLFVPQLLFLGGIALTTALLNARRHFAAPAFSPILCNVVTVAAVIASGAVARSLALDRFTRDETAVVILGLGTTAGYLVQLGAQLPALWKAKVHVRWVWQPGHPVVRTVLRLSAWTFGAVVANQVAFYIVQLLASAKSGDVTAFNYAYMFFQLPYAIFAVSIAVVLAPDLARQWTSGQVGAFRAQVASGLRLTLAILVPAAVGYAIVAQPLLRLALRHGQVTVGEAHLTATLVAIFGLGLPGFSVFLFLMRAYQAMKDTRSMFVAYVAENAMTLIVGISLYPTFGVRGLVVGWVGAYSLAAIGVFAHLGRRTGGLQGSTVAKTLYRVALATIAMAIVLEILSAVLPSGGSIVVLVVRVALLSLVGVGVYTVSALWLGVGEVRQVVTFRGTRRSNRYRRSADLTPEGGHADYPSGH
jgi:putative peptidoglycan lipid II flippase